MTHYSDQKSGIKPQIYPGYLLLILKKEPELN
jgi:hypothetical protein